MIKDEEKPSPDLVEVWRSGAWLPTKRLDQFVRSQADGEQLRVRFAGSFECFLVKVVMPAPPPASAAELLAEVDRSCTLAAGLALSASHQVANLDTKDARAAAGEIAELAGHLQLTGTTTRRLQRIASDLP